MIIGLLFDIAGAWLTLSVYAFAPYKDSVRKFYNQSSLGTYI